MEPICSSLLSNQRRNELVMCLYYSGFSRETKQTRDYLFIYYKKLIHAIMEANTNSRSAMRSWVGKLQTQESWWYKFLSSPKAWEPGEPRTLNFSLKGGRLEIYPGRVDALVWVQRQGKSWCLNLKAGRQDEFSLTWEQYSFLLYSGLQLIGRALRGQITLRRANSFTQSTNLNVDVISKHPCRKTPNVLPEIWASHGPVKLAKQN